MKKLLTLFVCLPLFAWAQEESTFQSDLSGMMQFNAGRVISLSEEFPADMYEWRPAEGVRSVSEALMHVASSNYFFGMMAGAELPEGVDLMTYEKSITEKEGIVMALKESYAFLAEACTNVSSETLTNEVSYPQGFKTNFRGNLLIAFGHGHDHLGQLVAYARMNEIVPPWSQKEEEGEGEENE